MESYFFFLSLSLFQLDFKPWHVFKPHFFSSYHSFFFSSLLFPPVLHFFSPLFVSSFVWCSSNFFLPCLPSFFRSPILLPFHFFLLFLFLFLFSSSLSFLLYFFSLFPPFILFSWFLPPFPLLSLSRCFFLFLLTLQSFLSLFISPLCQGGCHKTKAK